MLEANKELARGYVEDVFGKGDLAAVDKIVAEDFVNHVGSPSPGREPLKGRVTALRISFPDLNYRVLDLIAEGDRVVARVVADGTHLGDFRGIAPTGRRATWAGIEIFCIADGQIVEHWAEHDNLGRLQHLGVLPK